ncbi:hypothetical protein T4A_2239 [Trichinella pseudospiralis]|uniref:Uncharacterized protein n=1 Tax=Trichinella pseudospiralis TaxID=6337 RepID=A0A0V1DUC7_TRIPS|nr:hypothetical protein T4A_2239 [Trichinella pseudospiralis]
MIKIFHLNIDSVPSHFPRAFYGITMKMYKMCCTMKLILRHRKLIYTHVRNYIISWNFILLPALTGAGTATTSSSSSSPHGSPELISKKE